MGKHKISLYKGKAQRSTRAECYVCGNVIYSGGVMLPAGTKGRDKGQRLWRHQRCGPGMTRHNCNARLTRRYRRLFKAQKGARTA